MGDETIIIPTKNYRGKKVTVILPLDAYERLLKRAELENRPLANFCLNILLADDKSFSENQNSSENTK